MTYLVLARKWRPRSFDTLVGQDHVVRALTHALSTQRLHHAWLFTGTRGVGKTTLSRILAKSLNCEEGITATPCGVCRACTEIDSGRFIDYVELDAASNRGVDEMTQLLEQAVYAPGAGRFKVYMIDEVHMLTGHAFNAMLKTLEEPPAHVKFILATTDPQKIPVTVLSRCLQFNLKQMTAPAIVGYLQNVLEHEQMSFEAPALRLIAQAAAGSMRDALSLTDQAIAFSAGDLNTEAIRTMLGTIDQRYLTRLLLALSAANAAQVLDVADELAMRGLSYTGALADLAILLSRVAIAQRIEGSLSEDDPLTQDLKELARQLHPDLVQLFYSVAVHSRNELSLAPDEYAGFVMACLRMLALAPSGPAAEPERLGPASSGVATNDEGHDKPAIASEPAVSSRPDTVSGKEEAAVNKASPAPSAGSSAGSSAGPGDRQATDLMPERQAPSAPDVAPPIPPDSRSHSAGEQVLPVAAASRPVGPIPQVEQAQQASKADPAPAAKPGFSIDGRQPTIEPVRAEASFDNNEVPAWEDFPDDAGSDHVGAAGDETESYAGPIDPDELEGSLDSAELSAAAQAVMPALGAPEKKPRSPRLNKMSAHAWPELAAQLPLSGLAAELARQSEWVGVRANQVTLKVAVRTLAQSAGKARLCTVLSEHFGEVVTLDVEYGVTGDETAHAVAQAQRAERQKQAEIAAQADPFVQTLIDEFGARLVPDSVRAVSPNNAA